MLCDIEWIKTERLLIRPAEEEDAQDLLEIRGDADTAAWANVECLESIEDVHNHIDFNNCCVIVLGDEVIGMIEEYVDDELMTDAYFIGYYMKKSHRNQGYMTEALVALRENVWKDDIPMLWIFPDNDASKRVALKSGWRSMGCHLREIASGFKQDLEFFS